MTIFGMHWIDCFILLLYVVVILRLGMWAKARTKSADDFYLAGRRLGKFYQFFLNFGTSTNPDQAVAVSREIYRQGIGGMWIQFLVLFLTPFYWFLTFLLRRVRLVTLGDYFAERFRSRFLAAAFAIFTVILAVIGNGVGYMVAGKTLMALTPKPPEKCSPDERQSIVLFQEYQKLQAAQPNLPAVSQRRYEELNERYKKGELRAFTSYAKPLVIYAVSTMVVAVYTLMGGFMAAAVTDIIQGILITVFSFLLIPIGLARIGGFAGLHALVPDFKFRLFGSAATSEYAWYTILAMVLANLVSIIATATGMATAGSAKDEMTARVGMISGMFFKRLLMIFWALTGLLAIALFSGQLHDPDLIWGVMTRKLLFPGAIGVMLAGVMASKMSSLAAGSVSYSALFLRNVYQPLATRKSEAHYMQVGRVIIVLTLIGGVVVALLVNNLLELFKYFISIPAIFGASVWLGFIWRRLTRRAVIIQVFACFTIYALIPNLFQSLEWSKRNPTFLLETKPRIVTISTGALKEDIASGRARIIGQSIDKTRRLEPQGVFFDQVVRINPSDPRSAKMGLGRFNTEIWVLSWAGIDFTRFSKAQLVAVRFFFDALFPFVLLFLISSFTRPEPKVHLDYFFGKLRTPVDADAERENKAIAYAAAHPETFAKDKIWPGSGWELYKPGKIDYIGFFGSWGVVGVILFLLWLMVNIR